MRRLAVCALFLPVLLSFGSSPALAFYGGVVSADTTWSGTVLVDGDVVVEPQAMLTISPKTHIVFSPKASLFDDPQGMAGLCDIIAKGRLRVLGGPGTTDS